MPTKYSMFLRTPTRELRLRSLVSHFAATIELFGDCRPNITKSFLLDTFNQTVHVMYIKSSCSKSQPHFNMTFQHVIEMDSIFEQIKAIVSTIMSGIPGAVTNSNIFLLAYLYDYTNSNCNEIYIIYMGQPLAGP